VKLLVNVTQNGRSPMSPAFGYFCINKSRGRNIISNSLP
jgi:hypothetical protein